MGSLTDEQGDTLPVPLRFLDRRRPYVATIYGDAPATDLETNPNEVQISRVVVTSRDTLIAAMAGGGGQAVHLTPASGAGRADAPALRTALRARRGLRRGPRAGNAGDASVVLSLTPSISDQGWNSRRPAAGVSQRRHDERRT